MPRKFFFWIIVLAVAVVALGIWVGLLLYRVEARTALDSPYSAVYMQSGEVYYGKLHWWPHPYLENAWYLTQDQQSGGAVIAPFASTFSGPSSELDLNPKLMVWWVRLRADSQVAKGLEGASKIAVPAGQTQ